MSKASFAENIDTSTDIVKPLERQNSLYRQLPKGSRFKNKRASDCWMLSIAYHDPRAQPNFPMKSAHLLPKVFEGAGEKACRVDSQNL
jgi:hypothetical protein